MFFQWVSEGYTIATDKFSKGISPSKEIIKDRVERNLEYRRKLHPILLNQYMQKQQEQQEQMLWWMMQNFDSGFSNGGTWVNDYYRGDGTRVSGYWRDW